MSRDFDHSARAAEAQEITPQYFEGGSSVTSRRVIYTPSSFARSSLFYLQEVGTLEARSPHTSARSGLYSFLFFLVRRGSGTLTYEGKEYHMQTGDAAFVDCRRAYAHSTGQALPEGSDEQKILPEAKMMAPEAAEGSDGLWSLQWCHFYGPSAQAVYDKYTERGGEAVFRPENPMEFTGILDEMYEVASSEDYIRDMKLATLISRLLEEVMSESWHPENAVMSRRKLSLEKIRHYIDQHACEKLSLADVADAHFVNKQYLAQSFREACGMTINHYILERKITEAKKLLRFTDLSCEEIGQRVGLGGGNYFSRRFIAVEGIGPSEFRKRWQQ